jgi:glycosyltransferase EpsE
MSRERSRRDSMPQVSVITTVYNGERFFDRVVPSILDQSMRDFEWIIVDDGSTDRTPEMLRNLAASDPRVHVYSPGRIGRAIALNFAVTLARSEYIANQDFDDFSVSYRLDLQAAFLDRHPEVGVVGGQYVVLDEARGEDFIREPPLDHDAIALAMASRIPFAHTIAMFRKDAWRQARGYPAVDQLIDYRLWIAMGASGWQFAAIPAVLGTHYKHSESFWKANFVYRDSQLALARAQVDAIRALQLPMRARIYPLGRLVYWRMPDWMKRAARRVLAGSSERDLEKVAS